MGRLQLLWLGSALHLAYRRLDDADIVQFMVRSEMTFWLLPRLDGQIIGWWSTT
jgi:hypothetical protein